MNKTKIPADGKTPSRDAAMFTCEWDPESDIVRRSRNSASILGLDPATAARDTGENAFARIHDADKEHVVEMFRGITPDAPEFTCTYRFRRGDGRVVRLEENGRGEFDSAGTLLRLRCVVHDIPERMEALAREEPSSIAKTAAQSAIDIVDAMGEGMILCRLDGTVTAINPAMEKLTRLGRGQVLGRNLRSLLPRFLEGGDLVEMKRALDDALERRQVPEIQPVIVKRESAEPVTVSPSMVFITSRTGTPVNVVLTFKDVTRLHQQGELLNQIFDNTHMQMVCLDHDFNFVRVNRAYAEYCQRDAGFFPGKNYFELYPHPRKERAFREVLRTGNPVAEFEVPFRFPDQPGGGITYWDWSLRPIVNDRDETRGFLLCMLDVTQRVRARRQLADSERKYRELVENTNSIILRITPEQRITFFNEYAQEFFGYSLDEILGRNVVGTIVPEVDSEGRNLGRMTGEFAEHPEAYTSNNNENMCKDGRRVWVHWSNKAVRDREGKISEWLCVGTDITAFKQMEAKARRYQRRLKKLAEKVVTTEEEERWRISRYIHDTVVQNLSLSNIRMGGLMPPLQAAEMKAEAEKLRQIRKGIEKAIEDCRMVMSDLTPALLYELGLKAALKDLARKLEERHKIPILMEDNDREISLPNAVRGLLFESARELIMNALKHAGPCKIRVSMELNNGVLTLKVADDGIGFDPAIASQEADHDNHGGFGTFSIRERLEGLGGSLQIGSAPGKGTTALIHLPLDAC